MLDSHAASGAVEDRRKSIVELEALLRRRFHGRIRNLELRLENGIIVLRGQAPTYYVKQLAHQLLLQETQSIGVRNEITVI